MSTYLSRKQIVSTQGLLTTEVEVPEWGGKVLVRELTAIEATDFGLKAVAGGAFISRGGARDSLQISELVNMYPRIIAMCVVDDSLAPILSEDDIRALSARSVVPIQRIIEEVFLLSGLSDDEDEEDQEGETKDPS